MLIKITAPVLQPGHVVCDAYFNLEYKFCTFAHAAFEQAGA